MTITPGAPRPARSTPLALARGLLSGGVAGASLAALVVGAVIESAPLFVTGLVLPVLYGLVFFLAGVPRRAREAAVVPSTALAVIESREAVGGETSDVPVRFDLTVVPDDAPAYRVDVTQDINLVDLPDYRPRGVVVVQYPPERPWRVRIVKRPTPQWEERAARLVPVVTFTTLDGRAVTAYCESGPADLAGSRGRDVTVHYSPDDPAVFALDVEAERRSWKRDMAVNVVGVVVVAAAAAVAAAAL
ncbi:DUF3592 domain-containing protein [Streptomyces asoensis]|uniref:DUF3592 domain-containing protein n=1 Tax=Streptomyces asoensis TaxID=249586 RepID=UPI0037931050